MALLKDNDAFTLIEVIFVLMIISVISYIAVPFLLNSHQKMETKHFLQLFDADVLFIQNQALNASNDFYILLESDQYIVKQKEKNLYVREYPHHLTFRYVNMRRIQFFRLGTMESPGTIFFYEEDGTKYKIVFPLGKGRHYVEEQ